MEEEENAFNIGSFIKNGVLNLPESTYRKYDKEVIITKIIDKIQNGEIIFPDPPLYCSAKFKEDAFQKLKKYEPELVKKRHSNYQQKLSPQLWQKMNLTVDSYKSDYLYINTQSSDYDVDKLIDCFTGLQRMKCKREGRELSPFAAWNNKDYMKFVIERYIHDKENLTSFNLRESFYKLNSALPDKYKNMECNFFKATLAASVYDYFLRSSPHKRVLDISAGWGDRLLAAVSKNLDYYMAYDPNVSLQPGYKELINEYVADDIDKEKYQVVAAPFETAETNLRGKTFDLIFTSPPYFDLEVFTTEGEQSIVTHSTFDKWMVNFLFQSLYIAWDTLAADGNMVIHIDDFNKGDKKHRIIEPMVLFVCGWCSNARFDGVVGASGYNKKKEYKSPMWVFKHKASVKDEVEFCRSMLKEKYPELYDLVLKNKLKFGESGESGKSESELSRNIEIGQGYDFKGKLCVIQGNKYNIHTKKGYTDFYIQLEHVLKRVGFTVKLLDDDFISSIEKIQLDQMDGGAKGEGGAKGDHDKKKESMRKRMEKIRSKIAPAVERDMPLKEVDVDIEEEQEELEEMGLPPISFEEALQQQKERERQRKKEEEEDESSEKKEEETPKKKEEETPKKKEEEEEESPEKKEEEEKISEIYDEPSPQLDQGLEELFLTPLSGEKTKDNEKDNKQQIDLLLNFEDLFIDKSVPRFFSGMNIDQAFTFYKNLESKGTVMYPPAKFIYYTNSKTYSVDLHSPEYAEFALPKSNAFLFPYEDNGALNQTWRELVAYFKRVQDETDYIVVKSGFSADMNDVYLVITQKAESEQQFPKDIERAFPKNKRFVLNENISELRDFIFDFIRENNVDLVVIAEPYNKIVSQRKNEYRMWYLGGKFVDYFCFGIERDEQGKIKLIDNQAYNSKNEIHSHLKTLTDRLYHVILQKIRSLLKNDDFIPVAMRFDMSYAIDPIFLDKHAVTIKQKGNLRFYCNEIENMDGTFYTNIPVLDVDGKKTSLGKTFEKNLISILTSTVFQNMSDSKRVQSNEEFMAILNVIRKYTMKPPPSACNGIPLKKIMFTFGTSKPREKERIIVPEKEKEKEKESFPKSSEVQLIVSEPVLEDVEVEVEKEKEKEKEKDKDKEKEKPAKKIRVKIIKPAAALAASSASSKEKGSGVGVDPSTLIGSLALKERISAPSDKIVASPYFMNNRKIFVDFINKFFLTKFKDASEKGAPISCEDIKKAKTDSARLSLFPHQQIVKDYLNMYTPYRGLLLFHGLGSGKTCSSIAIAEGLKTEKQIIIMTPASLQVNYRNDLKKCGDEFYKRNQHWEFISLKQVPESERNEKIAQLAAILNISADMVRENGGAWMINVKNQKNNFPDLSTEERQQLEAQLDIMIESKYKFINYNGLNKNKIAELTNNGKTNPFDNAVVIIDEAHRIVNSISNQLKNLKPTKTDDKKAKALISVQLYKYLQNADNARIILLTGTPIINYPNELAILFNILRGYIKTWSFKLTVDKDQKFDEQSVVDMLKKHNIANYDYVKYIPSTQTITVTRNPFGFTGANKGTGTTSLYSGVIRAPAGDESNEQFLQNIKKMFASEQIRAEDPVISNFTALPDNFEDFKNKFLKINPDTFEIIGVKELPLFQRRILGLVSYFKSAQEQLMPRLLDIKIELIPMSNMQYSEYVDVRTDEISKTKRAQKNKNMYEVSSNSYRIFSRLCCNFVFPPANEMDGRPGRPKKEKMNEQNVDALTQEDVRERQAATFVEGVEEDAPLEVISGDSSYNEKIRELFQYYETRGDDLRDGEGGKLNEYSPKFLKMFQNISSPENKGLHLVYSQFRSLEGIGMFSLVLNANGFAQFKIKKDKDGEGWFVDIAPEDQDKPTYALYTGTEDAEEKEIVRNIFNSDFSSTPKNIKEYLERRQKTNSQSLSNMYGEMIKVFMITASGSEGINLRNVRFVHIMEPYWNGVRVEQVIGRAQRICSHEDLPEDEKDVQVFEYLAVFSAAQKEKLNKELKATDSGKTTDQALFDISKKKEEISRELLNAIKTTSIDCKVHKGAKCFEFMGTPDSSSFSYVPNIELDETEKEMVANVAVEEEVFKLLPATYKGENGERLVRSMKTNKVYYKNDKFDALTSSGKPFDVKELDQYGHIEQVGDKLKMFRV
jgi:tRNA1(Val) A37 N6-methylase TrmN6